MPSKKLSGSIKECLDYPEALIVRVPLPSEHLDHEFGDPVRGIFAFDLPTGVTRRFPHGRVIAVEYDPGRDKRTAEVQFDREGEIVGLRPEENDAAFRLVCTTEEDKIHIEVEI
jgi:hypothetical protein